MLKWDCRRFCAPGRFRHSPTERSPKTAANCVFDREPLSRQWFHSSAAWFKIRYSSFMAAWSLGTCPLVRTAQRSFEFKASMASRRRRQRRDHDVERSLLSLGQLMLGGRSNQPPGTKRSSVRLVDSVDTRQRALLASRLLIACSRKAVPKLFEPLCPNAARGRPRND